MARTFRLDGACHCGIISQPVRPPPSDALAYNYRATSGHPKPVDVCHCNSCRHATGSLYATYYPSRPPRLDGTTAFPVIKPDEVQDGVRRFFCPRCGCHVFRSGPDRERERYREDESALDPDLFIRWGVATGIMDPIAAIVEFANHVYIEDTKDGGSSCWLKETHRDSLFFYAQAGVNYYSGKRPSQLMLQQHAQPHPPVPGENQLHANCLCNSIRFYITRPDPLNKVASPTVPEFLPESVANTDWWLGENGTKYLASLCACSTCRLTTGFEIQPWAFVPRANIFFEAESTDAPAVPLDFDSLPSETFTTYETSETTVRHFCRTCGATAFSHQEDKPDLVRVSVGLLDATEGARAETWLKWWTKGIGFQEQEKLDRPPYDEYEQNDVVDCYARDLASWGGDAS